jgi:acylphosphatase
MAVSNRLWVAEFTPDRWPLVAQRDYRVSEDESWQWREIHYSGRVQGVGFRYTVQRIASRYPVTGFVKNLPNGKVQLVAEGSAAQVAAFLAEIADSMCDYIRAAPEMVAPATHQFREFEIRF